MITPNLMKMVGDAMKAHDSVRVSTLRMLSSELKNEKINLQKELGESDEERVIRREARKRKDAIEQYIKVGASDRAENEKAELAILSEFLPAEVTEEQMIKLVEESIAKFKQDQPAEATPQALLAGMGKVIADVKSKNSGIDGGVVANLVRAKLSNG
ncbi:MAG: GatB/YqeY domain-containing protein [Patescibacteria group bacterium]